jgi:hypothetical protein
MDICVVPGSPGAKPRYDTHEVSTNHPDDVVDLKSRDEHFMDVVH